MARSRGINKEGNRNGLKKEIRCCPKSKERYEQAEYRPSYEPRPERIEEGLRAETSRGLTEQAAEPVVETAAAVGSSNARQIPNNPGFNKRKPDSKIAKCST